MFEPLDLKGFKKLVQYQIHTTLIYSIILKAHERFLKNTLNNYNLIPIS